VKARKIAVIYVTACIFVFLLSAPFQQISMVSADISADSVIVYGAEAQIFASMLLTEYSDLNIVFDSQSPVIVISDINLVNLQNITSSMKNGAILVAINLPDDNGLVDAPRHTYGSKKTIGGLMVSETSQENVVPPYWIIVTKETTPSFTGQYSGGYDNEQSYTIVMQAAFKGVYYALFPNADPSDYPDRSEVVIDDNRGEFYETTVCVWRPWNILFVVGSVLLGVMLMVVAVAVLLLRRVTKV
jgi:hypothetical protein